MFRKNGQSNGYNKVDIRTQVANIIQYGDAVVACDSSQVVEYKISATCNDIWILVNGWFEGG